MNMKREAVKKSMTYIIGAVIGGILGFLYYRFIGCAGGACPITSSPYISTLYGTVLGLLIGSLVAGK